jgi:hypothetical protein
MTQMLTKGMSHHLGQQQMLLGQAVCGWVVVGAGPCMRRRMVWRRPG